MIIYYYDKFVESNDKNIKPIEQALAIELSYTLCFRKSDLIGN